MIGNDRMPSPYQTLSQDRPMSEEVHAGRIIQLPKHNGESFSELDTSGPQPLVGIADPSVPIFQESTDWVYLTCKRAIDIVGAIIALVVLFPFLIIVAFAIYLENPGPILFPQIRVGRNNLPFRFYKFRSMVKNAADLQASLLASNEATGPIFKMRNDPRVTRVGRILRRYSIDELPQFFNVLKGDMSLVGPRPHLPSEVALYTLEQHKRLSVQPGLVCMREVTGRSELTFDRWIETDLEYIACRSMRKDLSILMRLVPAVIGARGAY